MIRQIIELAYISESCQWIRLVELHLPTCYLRTLFFHNCRLQTPTKIIESYTHVYSSATLHSRHPQPHSYGPTLTKRHYKPT